MESDAIHTRRHDGIRRYRSNAFTLLELLVVVAIVALLLGILVPAIAGARNLARQTVGMSAMRQMMIGYQTHQFDHKGYLLWGYPPAAVDGRPLRVTLPSGHTLPGPGQIALPVMRYPVRIVSYQQNLWQMLYSHADPPEPPKAGDTLEEAHLKAYKLSTNPTFGLNTVFVGGDLGFDGFGAAPHFRPNHDGPAIFRASRANRPSRLIVFAESQLRGPGADPDKQDGLHRVTPPRTDQQVWRADGDGFEIVQTDRPIGLPQGRYGDEAITGFFDGHVELLSPADMDDMTRWSNDAQDRDFALN